MYHGYFEEGDECPKCGSILGYPKVKDCSCHINPPCSACTSILLTCPKCCWEEDAPEYKEVLVVPGLHERVYKPRPLDNTKIDYRIRSHTHFSMIKEGVYPEGMSKGEVSAAVKGTFGGRFEYFGNGNFKYIAYTD
jgi:hypothetical protein